jgi:hypothetical protein
MSQRGSIPCPARAQVHGRLCLSRRPVLTWVTVDTMDMSEISVRVLDESEWSLYHDIRLRALAESPGSFTATLADEADRDEQFWRDRMTRSYRLLVERGELPQGIVSLGPDEQDPTAAEVFGLFVVPEARSTGVS